MTCQQQQKTFPIELQLCIQEEASKFSKIIMYNKHVEYNKRILPPVRLSPHCRRRFWFFCTILGTGKQKTDQFNEGYQQRLIDPNDYNGFRRGVHRFDRKNSIACCIILSIKTMESGDRTPEQRAHRQCGLSQRLFSQ